MYGEEAMRTGKICGTMESGGIGGMTVEKGLDVRELDSCDSRENKRLDCAK